MPHGDSSEGTAVDASEEPRDARAHSRAHVGAQAEKRSAGYDWLESDAKSTLSLRHESNGLRVDRQASSFQQQHNSNNGKMREQVRAKPRLRGRSTCDRCRCKERRKYATWFTSRLFNLSCFDGRAQQKDSLTTLITTAAKAQR